MIKVCLIRGCRILLMLGVLLFLFILSIFTYSPDIGFVEAHVEQEMAKILGVDSVDIQYIAMHWDTGPAVDFGAVHISAEQWYMDDTKVAVAYPIFQAFRMDFAPQVLMQGGKIGFSLDSSTKQKALLPNIKFELQDVAITWMLAQEQQTLSHVYAYVSAFASYVDIQADGLQATLLRSPDGWIDAAQFSIQGASVLPPSWQTYVQGLDTLNITVRHKQDTTWAWQLEAAATHGILSFDQVHIRIPFYTLAAKGTLGLNIGAEVSLHFFEAEEVKWRHGRNFADLSAQWSNGVLHIEATNGSTSAKMLWSWLWAIDDGLFHDWLSSMQYGQVSHARASIDLDWYHPLQAAPTRQNLVDMKYHVVAQVQHVDIALGLGGDYLYQVTGKVMIHERGLKAEVDHAILNDDLAVVSGTYEIDWSDLFMTVNAQGTGDVGRLHRWLEPDSGQMLAWGEATAMAKVYLKWDIDESEPQEVLVYLQPTVNHAWQLRPYDIPIQVSQGVAVWDYHKGLSLKDLQVTLPWFQGKLTAFLDKQQDWKLSSAQLDAYAPLAELADAFVLPVTNPQGITKLHVQYKQQAWSGYLDLTANDWDNFAGYDKESASEDLVIPFSGKSTQAILPVHIEEFSVHHHDFSFDASIHIDATTLNFVFKDVVTPAFNGAFGLIMPLNESLPWHLTIDAAFMDKPVLTKYLADAGGSEAFSRPWTVQARFDEVVWEVSSAEQVYLSFSSDRESKGEVSARKLVSGGTELERIAATFTLYEQGKYELHLLEAYGSGQRLQASGTVYVQKDGVLRWQGLALMNGEFGTLMKQAELDQLFREGKMNAVLIGHGEFKDGEPWWRNMKGGFKLRVDDGRILEGGTLTHLLAAISLVDLPKYLIFDRGDVVGEGLFYDKLQVEGVFEANKLYIDQLAFLSSALDAGGTGEVDLASGALDIVLVARPWQNIESLISRIPLLGSILTGEDKSLLRKVYHIHGPASDALVDEVDPEDVGLPKGGYLEDLFTPSRWFEAKPQVEEKR